MIEALVIAAAAAIAYAHILVLSKIVDLYAGIAMSVIALVLLIMLHAMA